MVGRTTKYPVDQASARPSGGSSSVETSPRMRESETQSVSWMVSVGAEARQDASVELGRVP